MAISCAVYSETRGLASSKGLAIMVCWSPGLYRQEGQDVSQLELAITGDAARSARRVAQDWSCCGRLVLTQAFWRAFKRHARQSNH